MWYVVWVQSGTEEEVRKMCLETVDRDCLKDCFVIRYERMKRYCGKWNKESRIMFPGYIFLRTDKPEKLYQELKNIPRFTKLLGKDGEDSDYFTPISPSEERRLKLISGDAHVVEMSVGYIEGDKIVVQSGPLKGMEGSIKKINRHKREAIIEFDMFGQATEVTVGLEIVSKG